MRMNKKNLTRATILVFSLAVSGEFFARSYLGLGTPPLSIAHPKIEYMFKPDQDIYRFGNHIAINHYGMRAPTFTKKKNSSDDDLRVMVFGDSVLNGGNQTDQKELSTTILQENLIQKTGRKVVVGNISAGSWGPGNWLAYAKEYGFFDADVVILVISSHDYVDNPTFQPLNENTHPTKTPILALSEAFSRYLPRYLPRFGANENTSKEADHFSKITDENEVNKALADLKEFLLLAKNKSKSVLVFQHWEKEEADRGEAKIGNRRIRDLCESIEVPVRQLLPYFQKSMQSGNNPYRDNIHPNPIGQKLIAKALIENMPNKALQPTVLPPLSLRQNGG